MTLNRSMYSLKYLRSHGYKRVTAKNYTPQPEDYVIIEGQLTAFRLEHNLRIDRVAGAMVYTLNLAEGVGDNSSMIRNTYCRGYLIKQGFKEDLELGVGDEPEAGDFFSMFETSRRANTMMMRCEPNMHFTQSPAQILRAPKEYKL